MRPSGGSAPQPDAPPEKRKANLRPLASLLPYVKRYRGRALAALGALILAALTTLDRADRGAAHDRFRLHRRAASQLINSYFLVMIGVAAVLALASALRYYLVTTLGERIVADLRGDVFAHVTSLSADFFDEAKTGEVISRLTADTTQIKAAVGSSVSVALRNLVLFVGASAMMVVTSPRLSAFVLGAIPIIVLPLYAFGRAVRRRSRSAQDTLADASAYAAELIGAVRVLQAFTNERLGIARFRDAVERAFDAARAFDPRARDAHRVRDLSGLRPASSSCCGSARRTCWPRQMTPGRLGQFILYAVLGGQRARLAVGNRRRGRAGLRRGGAAVRNSRHQAGDRAAGASGCAAVAAARRGRVRRRALLLSDAAQCLGARRRIVSGAPGREGRDRRPFRAPARARSFICCCASTIRAPAASRSTACGLPISIRRICARASRWCRRTA